MRDGCRSGERSGRKDEGTNRGGSDEDSKGSEQEDEMNRKRGGRKERKRSVRINDEEKRMEKGMRSKS